MREGWTKYRLIDVTKKIGSGATPKGGKKDYKESGISLFRSLNVYDGEFKEENLAFIDEIQASKLSNVVVEEGDVLLNITGASIARCCVAPPELLPARVNQHVSIVRPKTEYVDTDFLAYLLVSKEYKDALLQTGEKAGATRQALTKAQLQDFEILAPPLPEQKRIVAILDEAFAGIATAVANTEKNLANARELETSSFHKMLACGGDNWSSTTVGEQVLLQRGFDITKKQQVPGKVPVVSSGGIKSYHAEAMASGPGVIIGRKGSIGQVHYVSDDYWPHDTTLWVKDFKGNNPKFVFHFFKALDLKRLDSGTANPALNRNLIHPLSVSWPSTKIQTEIVRKADAIASTAQSLENIYLDKLRSLAELKQSILHKAFSGELTAQPERALQEAVA